MNIAIFFGLLALGLLAAWALLLIIPNCLTSLFRYELWKVRDELADDIRHGAYINNRQPTLLLENVETAIQMIGQLSLVNLLAFNWIARDVVLSQEHFQIDKLEAHDRERVRPLANRYQSALLKRVLFGSWSGLFIVSLLGPVFVFRGITSRLSEAFNVVRPVEVLGGRHGSTGGLSAYV